MRLKQLQNRKAVLVKAMRGLSDAAEKNGQDSLGEKEQADFDAFDKELSTVNSAIERELRLLEQEKSLATVADLNAPSDEEQHQLTGAPRAPRIDFSTQPTPKNFKGPKAVEHAYRTGMFLMATIGGNQLASKWCADHGVFSEQQLAMGTNINSAGGFLVPPEFSTAIIDLRDMYGVARQNLTIEPMGGDVLNIPKVLSGLTASWFGENTEMTAGDAAWTQVELIARKLGALAKYSTELDEDAVVSMADTMAKEIARAFAYAEDAALFIGDGTSTYGGVTGLLTKVAAATASVVTAASTHTGFETLDLADFHKAIGALPEYAEKFDPKWYFSKVGYANSAMRLQDAAGGNTSINIANGAPVREFLGYPVVTSPIINSTLGAQASTIVAYFGCLDLAAAMGERRGITIARSEHAFFTADQIGVRGTERVAINVHSVGSTSVAGPIIALKTAAS